MIMPLPAYIARRLLKIAAILDQEAETWADGWAVRQPDGTLAWPDKNEQWAHVRWLRLTNGAAFLRQHANRKK